jgi:hypothetical protein
MQDDESRPDIRPHKQFVARADAIRRRVGSSERTERRAAFDKRLLTTDRGKVAALLGFMAEAGQVDTTTMGTFIRMDEATIGELCAMEGGLGCLTTAKNGLKKNSFSCRETGQYPRSTIVGASCKAAQFLELCTTYKVTVPDEKRAELEAAITAAPGRKIGRPEPLIGAGRKDNTDNSPKR